MDRKSLGKRIRTERSNRNLTQEQLAEAAGVSTTYIGFVERGERTVTLEKLIDIANVLHVSIDYLIEDSINVSPSADFTLLKALWTKASPKEQSMILDLISTLLRHSQNN